MSEANPVSDPAPHNDKNALPDSVTVKQSGTVQIITSAPAWVWRCNECGWLGTGHYSESAAIKEAAQHAWEDHQIALCSPGSFGHPGHDWHHVKGTDAIDECARCGWDIGK